MADSLTNDPARDRLWSRACRARHPVRPGVSEPSQVRILLRPPVMRRLSRHISVTSMLSDSGSERERPAPRICGQLRSDAVSLTVHSALTSAYIHDQVRYSNVCVVRDEEAAGSNPATPAGKRQVTKQIVTCPLHYTFPGARFWEPVRSGQRTAEGAHRSPARQLLSSPFV
jgi:hypothetical protein